MEQTNPNLSEAEARLEERYRILGRELEQTVLSLEKAVNETRQDATVSEHLNNQEKLAVAIRRLCQHQKAMRSMDQEGSVTEDPQEQAQLQKGIDLLEQVIRTRTQLKLGNDSNLQESQYELALLYHDKGDQSEALKLLEDLIEVREGRETGEESNYVDYYSTLALLNMEANNVDKAIMLYEKTIELQSARMGNEHSETAYERLMLAQAYTMNNQLAEAIRLLEQLVPILAMQRETSDPNLISAKSMLAELYVKTGQYQEAINTLEGVAGVQGDHSWEVQQLLMPGTLQLLEKAHRALDGSSEQLSQTV